VTDIGVNETMRWFWLSAYEATAGKPQWFDHAPDDREAVQRSTNALMNEISRLRSRSAQRLLNASWPLWSEVPQP
jgi:hypothetical protein